MSIKNYLCIIAIALLLKTGLKASPRFNISGFIRNDSVLSTRQAIYYSETLSSLFFPVPYTINALGKDPYQQPSASLLNFFPSLIFSVDDIKVLGADALIYLNADFIGFFNQANDITILNFYGKLDWKQDRLTFGYFPHPLISANIYPNTINANYANPITPFSINPQIRFEHHGCWWNMKISTYSEYLFTNDGPGIPFLDNTFATKIARFNNTYSRNAVTPSFNISIEAFSNKALLGGSFDISFHRPRIASRPNIIGENSPPIAAKGEFLKSLKYSLFAGYSIKDLNLATQFIIGQNGMDIQSFGGYAVSKILDNGLNKYTNVNFYSLWFDAEYSKFSCIQPGIYTGFVTVTGSSDCIIPSEVRFGLPETYFTIEQYINILFPYSYGFTQKNLYTMFRIAPRVWLYPLEQVAFGFEAQAIKTNFAQLNEAAEPIDNQLFRTWMFYGLATMQYLF